jgi:hypothetical protein
MENRKYSGRSGDVLSERWPITSLHWLAALENLFGSEMCNQIRGVFRPDCIIFVILDTRFRLALYWPSKQKSVLKGWATK